MLKVKDGIIKPLLDPHLTWNDDKVVKSYYKPESYEEMKVVSDYYSFFRMMNIHHIYIYLYN